MFNTFLKSFFPTLLTFAFALSLQSANASQGAGYPKRVGMSAGLFKLDQKNYIAITLKNEKKWHTYWKNPGDAGLAVKFDFKLDGQKVEPNELEWPVPKKYLEAGDILTYGYEGEYTFFFETDSALFEKAKTSPLSIHGTWLVCKDICIPGEDTISMVAPPQISEPSAKLKKALASLPQAAEAPEELEIFLAKANEENKLILQYTWKGVDIKRFDQSRNLLTPLLANPLDYKREKLFFDAKTSTLYGTLEMDWDGEYEDPERPLPQDGVFKRPLIAQYLFKPYSDSKPIIIEKTFNQFSIGGNKAFDAFLAGLTPIEKIGESNDQSAASERSLAMVLLFAFIGGLILNLMPCVLPVISLKLFGLILHSNESKSEILKHNLAYTGGILATFMALAAVVLSLKTSGEQIGWGFQLQSPGFVFIMMLVIFILAMNMMGLFEFVTPGGNKLGNVALKKGFSGDFLNGVLATILSTPCSAPFLGTALTFAFTTSNLNIFLTLIFVGLGLAFPFIVTGVFPNLVKFLPKPGLWMDHLKKILGLTLLLTFVWLYDILSNQIDYGFSGIYINTIFVTLFFAFFFRKSISKSLFLNIIFFLIPAALTFSMIKSKGLETSYGSGDKASAKSSHNLPWKPWSREAMSELKGEWIFIDFTADWCLTCKVNEKLVLNTEDFSELVKERKLKLLLGDWTKRDDAITSFLRQYDIVGVPAYFIQKPNGEVISLGEVISIEKIKRLTQ